MSTTETLAGVVVSAMAIAPVLAFILFSLALPVVFGGLLAAGLWKMVFSPWGNE